MGGAYASHWAINMMRGGELSVQVLTAIIASALIGLGLATILYFSVARQLAKIEILASLLALFGLSLIMINIIILIWSVDVRELRWSLAV
ncbi:MAG: hypothetical protein QW470_06640 [Candidatus Caldarchaeum sp.]